MRHAIIEEDLRQIIKRDLRWDAFAGKTVLITGAYGFIPAYLVETLLYLNEQGDGLDIRVLALCRDRKKAAARFAHYRDRADLVFVYQDASQPVAVDGPVDFVVHGASWASPKYYGRDPVGVMAPNLFGTHYLLRLARDKGASGFLFLSSAENYGAPPPEHIPVKETYPGVVNPIDVRSCYAESKRVGETMCSAWWHQYGVPAKCARIFHTYGPGMSLEDGRVFADFVANVVRNEDIEMKSDGRAVRAYCYLADAVDGLFRVLLEGRPGEAYNLGNDQAACSVLELAHQLLGLFPERQLKVKRAKETRRGYLETRVSRTIPDTSKVRAMGWKPQFSLADGFARTVRSFE